MKRWRGKLCFIELKFSIDQLTVDEVIARVEEIERKLSYIIDNPMLVIGDNITFYYVYDKAIIICNKDELDLIELYFLKIFQRCLSMEFHFDIQEAFNKGLPLDLRKY